MMVDKVLREIQAIRVALSRLVDDPAEGDVAQALISFLDEQELEWWSKWGDDRGEAEAYALKLLAEMQGRGGFLPDLWDEVELREKWVHDARAVELRGERARTSLVRATSAWEPDTPEQPDASAAR
jgi:hypothetical protein